MNDTHSEPGLAQIPETAPQSDSLWSSTVAFLKRDIKSFFPRDDRSGTPTEQGAGASDDLGISAPAPVKTPIESLVDMSKLPEMAFRRDVIDWRDNFHVNLMNALSRLNDAFAQWAAAGFDDTLLRWKMKPEVVHGEKKDIQPRVQARGGQVGHRA
ncbi:hypothetical protein, partial [Acidovorax sp.]|uniref:hypothetical protein n=1 Tax=Acidovorax sp. TaxID=1872122 RepID=UPI0031DC63BD